MVGSWFCYIYVVLVNSLVVWCGLLLGCLLFCGWWLLITCLVLGGVVCVSEFVCVVW